MNCLNCKRIDNGCASQCWQFSFRLIQIIWVWRTDLRLQGLKQLTLHNHHTHITCDTYCEYNIYYNMVSNILITNDILQPAFVRWTFKEKPWIMSKDQQPSLASGWSIQNPPAGMTTCLTAVVDRVGSQGQNISITTRVSSANMEKP